MFKEELETKTDLVLNETRDALQMIYDSLNRGQQKKIIKNEKVKELFDRYNVQY